MKTRDVALGSVYAMMSRAVLLVCGFVVQIVLARRLGPEWFGLYSLVLSILVWIEYLVTTGLPTVFQKVISENRRMIHPIVASLTKVTLPYTLVITVVFWALSPMIASGMNDSRLIGLLLVASVDIPFFGIYTTLVCSLNGYGRFLLNSSLAAFYSISRTVFIVAAVLVGFGVAGALVGNAVGSLCGLALAWFFTRRILASDPDVSNRSLSAVPNLRSRILTFGVPVLFYQLFTSVLIHMDIWLVKAFAADSASGDANLGYYAVAYNLARIPYFIVTGITFTLFPAVSKAVFESRREDAQNLVKQMLRMVLLLLLPLVGIVYATADDIIILLFSADYLPAADSLRILFAGIAAYCVFLFFVSVISAQDRPAHSALISLALIPVALVLHYFLIGAYGIEGAATATAIVSAIGAIVAGGYVWRRFGAIVDLPSLLKAASASIVVFALAQYEVIYSWHLLLGYTLLAAVYGVSLFVLREFDLALIVKALRK